MKYFFTLLTAIVLSFPTYSQIDPSSFEIKPSADLLNAGIVPPDGWHKEVVMPTLLNKDRVTSGSFYHNALAARPHTPMNGFAIVHLWVAKDGVVKLVGSDSENAFLKEVANDIGIVLNFEPATWQSHPLDVQVRARIDFDQSSRSFEITIEEPPFEAFPFVSLLQPRDLDPSLATLPDDMIIELDDDEVLIESIDELSPAPGSMTESDEDDAGIFAEEDVLISDIITLEEAPSFEEETTYPDPDVFYHADEYPQVLNLEEVRAKVQLPEVLASTGYTTTVPVRVLVSPTGEYVKHKMLVQRHPVAMKVVADHVSELEFRPARVNGEAIYYWTNVEFPMGE